MSAIYQKISTAIPYLFWASISLVLMLMFIELPEKQGGIAHVDKLVHVVLFAWLTGIGLLTFHRHKYRLIIALITFGAIVEPLQSWLTETRQASVYDWLADVAGIVLCILISAALSKLQVNK